MPFWGGEDFIFFRPVFNLADFSISLGVGIIILNQKKYFAETPNHQSNFSNKTEMDNRIVKPDLDGGSSSSDT